MIGLRLGVHRLILLLLTLPMVVSASVDHPLAGGQFTKVGSGRLSWWGMTVYDATLYAPQGHYHPDNPHYLEITYRFGFTREQLASGSLEEIERLRGRRSDRNQLLSRFRSIFPDVAWGDRILALHRPGEGVEFYQRERLLGRIADAALAADFFSIWLDPATRKPGLREQLLGLRAASTGQ